MPGRLRRFNPVPFRCEPGQSTLALPLAIAALALACSSEPTAGEEFSSPVRFERVPVGDTVLSLLAPPLVVEVDAPRGTPVVLRANELPLPRLPQQWLPTLYFSREPDGRAARSVDTVMTDAAGRVSVYLRLGRIATDAVVTAFVPALGDSAQTRIVVRPGAPRRLLATPRDTSVYVARGYALRANLVDFFGNPISITDATYTSDSAAADVAAGGQVTGRAIGRARLLVRAGPYADTAWASVVPEGRIAAVRPRNVGPDTTELVLVNLDGSGYRSFKVHKSDITQPAWHPDGGYLVASLRLPSEPSGTAPRLAAFDTTTGAWRPLAGTSGPWADGHAQFSRDGQWIYATRYFSGGASAIYRIRADGTGPGEPVGYDPATAVQFDRPSPSPDGSRVAMTVGVSSGTYTLIVPTVPPLGEPPAEFGLVGALPTGGHPRWSPVGEELLMFGTEGMWLMGAGARSVAERRYLAGAWANSTHVTGGYRGASWSSDGRWIVAKASAGLILVEVATDQVLPLAFGGHLADPAWRPR